MVGGNKVLVAGIKTFLCKNTSQRLANSFSVFRDLLPSVIETFNKTLSPFWET